MQSNETSNFLNYGRVCDRLNKLLAPTRENFELIRDTYAGCKAAFEKDRMGPRRRYDVDITPHLLTTPAFADNIPRIRAINQRVEPRRPQYRVLARK